MKRLWRIIFNGLTLLSLLMCATVCVLWARSYYTEDRISRVIKGNRCSLVSTQGIFAVCVPPESVLISARKYAEASVARLRNDRACWFVEFKETGPTDAAPEKVYFSDVALFLPDSLPIPGTFFANEVDGMLLAALEDPNRFVAAHPFGYFGAAEILEKYSGCGVRSF